MTPTCAGWPRPPKLDRPSRTSRCCASCSPRRRWPGAGGVLDRLRASLVRPGRNPAVRGQLLGSPGNCPDETWLELLEESAQRGADRAGRHSHPPRPTRRRARRLADPPRTGTARLAAGAAAHPCCAGGPDGGPARATARPSSCPPARPWTSTSSTCARSSGCRSAPAHDIRLRLSSGSRTRQPAAATSSPSPADLLPPGAVEESARRLRAQSPRARAPGGRRRSPCRACARALRRWLDGLADQPAGQGLPASTTSSTGSRPSPLPRRVAVNPEAVRRLADHDLGPVLAPTLRAGLFDEYGWPALDRAAGDWRPVEGDDEDQRTGQWPYLLVRPGDQVTVPARTGWNWSTSSHPRHQRRRGWRPVLRYVDGQLLVSWDLGQDRPAYWSGTPDDVFTPPTRPSAKYTSTAPSPCRAVDVPRAAVRCGSATAASGPATG